MQNIYRISTYFIGLRPGLSAGHGTTSIPIAHRESKVAFALWIKALPCWNMNFSPWNLLYQCEPHPTYWFYCTALRQPSMMTRGSILISRYCSSHHKIPTTVLPLGISRTLYTFIYPVTLITVGGHPSSIFSHQRIEPYAFTIICLMLPIMDIQATSLDGNHGSKSLFSQWILRFLLLLMPWFWKSKRNMASSQFWQCLFHHFIDVALGYPPAWTL